MMIFHKTVKIEKKEILLILHFELYSKRMETFLMYRFVLITFIARFYSCSLSKISPIHMPEL